jgi:hypothetical protein
MSVEGDAFDPQHPTAEVRAVLLRVATSMLADPDKLNGVCRTSEQTLVGTWAVRDVEPVREESRDCKHSFAMDLDDGRTCTRCGALRCGKP